MAQNFAALRAAAVDARAHNIFYRQTQLEKLHESLRKETAAILDAIVNDNGSTRAEAAIEYYAAMKCARDAYQLLQPAKALEAEYLVAAGKDAPQNREPVGIVYIEPIRHTFFYSVVSPVCSAIASGNSVVVLLERNLRACNAILRRILTSALENESFVITDQPVTAELPTSHTVFVLQESDEQLPRSNQIVSVSSPCVAVVDRTANPEMAAQEIVAARFAFGGRSPYAPDVVLVNEFAQKDFLRDVVQECIKYSRNGGEPVNGSIITGAKVNAPKVSNAIEAIRSDDPDLRVIVQEATYAVVETVSRQNLLAKHTSPILVVHSIRSLDDGIDLVNNTISAPCTATYHFGTPETCKYLCQFISSAASFVNHIPRELLLGPPSPQQHPVNPANRYPASLFTVPRPQYIVPSAQSQKLAAANSSGPMRLATEASKALVIKERASGKGIGFFEQGLLMNAALILAGTVTSCLVSGLIAYKRWSR